MLWRLLAAQAAVPVVSGLELQRRLERGERVQVIDVREPDEFARGHIPGARLIPLRQLPARLAELDPDQEYVLVCRSGNRSGVACRLMRQRGFTRASNLTGGMLAWRGPVTR